MYSDQVRREALRLAETGLSPAQISCKMGGRPTEPTIKKWIEGFVPTGKRTKRCYIPVEAKEDALIRLFLGEDYVEVAKELGCTPGALLGWRRKYITGGIEAITTTRDLRERINRSMREKIGLE